MKKKHELLKYAYDNYPKGCLLDVSIRASGDYSIENMGNGEFLIIDTLANIILYDSLERSWQSIIQEDTPVISAEETTVHPLKKIAVKLENRIHLMYFKRWLKQTKGIDANHFEWTQATQQMIVSLDGSRSVWSEVRIFDTILTYENWCLNYVDGGSLPTYWATAQDGTDIFIGDNFYSVISINDEWTVVENVGRLGWHDNLIENERIFGKRENAEKFIKDKEKDQFIELFETSNITVTISPEAISLQTKDGTKMLKKELTPTNFKTLVDAVNKVANSIK